MGLIVLGEIGDMIEAGTLFDALAMINKPGVELFIGEDDQPCKVIVGYTHNQLRFRGREYTMVNEVYLSFFLDASIHYTLLRSAPSIVSMFAAAT